MHSHWCNSKYRENTQTFSNKFWFKYTLFFLTSEFYYCGTCLPGYWPLPFSLFFFLFNFLEMLSFQIWICKFWTQTLLNMTYLYMKSFYLIWSVICPKHCSFIWKYFLNHFTTTQFQQHVKNACYIVLSQLQTVPPLILLYFWNRRQRKQLSIAQTET